MIEISLFRLKIEIGEISLKTPIHYSGFGIKGTHSSQAYEKIVLLWLRGSVKKSLPKAGFVVSFSEKFFMQRCFSHWSTNSGKVDEPILKVK